MKRFRVRQSGPLRGSARVPGDKSIGHRSLIFAALADGPSHVTGLSGGLDNVSTAQAFRDMGVAIELGKGEARITGVGLRGLRMAAKPLDCGNSGTTMRLLAGLLSAQLFGSVLEGDESLTRRPMGRVVVPLRARGANITGRRVEGKEDFYPPLRIAPLVESESLKGLEYEMPVASAQVKSALLLSGLYAKGPTVITEPVVSRDHTERMMLALGIPLSTMASAIVLDPDGWSPSWKGFEWRVPGDLSSAAFLIVGALAMAGSEVHLENVGVNPTRTGLLDALRPMCAALDIVPKGDAAGGEPIAEITIKGGAITGGRIGGELATRMIDEIPSFCALGAMAKGRTEIRDAEELRVKESDRIATMAKVLRAFGVECTELQDGMIIEGGGPLTCAHVESRGDHRIAMSAVLLGLRASGETIIDDVDCVDTSFPGFADLMRGLGADIRTEQA